MKGTRQKQVFKKKGCQPTVSPRVPCAFPPFWVCAIETTVPSLLFVSSQRHIRAMRPTGNAFEPPDTGPASWHGRYVAKNWTSQVGHNTFSFFEEAQTKDTDCGIQPCEISTSLHFSPSPSLSPELPSSSFLLGSPLHTFLFFAPHVHTSSTDFLLFVHNTQQKTKNKKQKTKNKNKHQRGLGERTLWRGRARIIVKILISSEGQLGEALRMKEGGTDGKVVVLFISF